MGGERKRKKKYDGNSIASKNGGERNRKKGKEGDDGVTDNELPSPNFFVLMVPPLKVTMWLYDS